MIVVCEPQCKGISHEKVNSGFIYGLLLAYPKEKIIFFADSSHFNAIKYIFKSNKVNCNKVELVPIEFDPGKMYSARGIIEYLTLNKSIFNKTISLGELRILYLSTSPIILFTIKLLKKFRKFKNICCSFVLHGELEDVANSNYREPYIPVFVNQIKQMPLGEKAYNVITNWDKIPFLITKLVLFPFKQTYSKYTLIYRHLFRTKKMMMWRHSNQYKYISLSPHVTENAKIFLDTVYLNFHTIYLPIIFAKRYPSPKNKYIKFAVFGYGDSARMHKMLTLLSGKKISKPYEIKIISMDNRGTEGFQNIHRVSQGKVLARKEMEGAVRDVDVFINLYDKNRYRLGCSLSIFEAFSYLKPVLYTANPGYDYFNKRKRPIGMRAESLADFVEKMCDIIEHFSKYRKRLASFQKNMLEYREEYAIQNNLTKLRESFTFNHAGSKRIP